MTNKQDYTIQELENTFVELSFKKGLTPIEAWQEVVKHVPNSSYSYRMLSAYQAGMNQSKEALQSLNRAIELGDESTDAFANRAELKIKTNQLEGVFEDIDKAFESLDEDDESYLHLIKANAYVALGKINQAKKAYAKHLRTSYYPNKPQINKKSEINGLESVVRELNAQKDFSAALGICQNHIFENPTSTQGYRLKAQAHIDQNDFKSAIELLKTMIALGTRTRKDTLYQGILHVLEHEPKKAEISLVPILNEDHLDSQIWKYLALSRLQQNKMHEAQIALDYSLETFVESEAVALSQFIAVARKDWVSSLVMHEALTDLNLPEDDPEQIYPTTQIQSNYTH